MKRQKKPVVSKWLVFGIVVLALIFVFEIIFFTDLWKIIKEHRTQTPVYTLSSEILNFSLKSKLMNSTSAVMYLPAVNNEGKGVITLLVVEAIPGNGRTMVDIDNLFFWADTQISIKKAKQVASNITGINTNKFDIVYNVYANATLIGGESAGAAITLATISVIKNKTLSKNVMITGTIDENGTIGRVSSILPKIEVAKQLNVTTFLVPKGQSIDYIYKTEKSCKKIARTEICVENILEKKVNVSEETGINIIEVSNITEAIPYFFN